MAHSYILNKIVAEYRNSRTDKLLPKNLTSPPLIIFYCVIVFTGQRRLRRVPHCFVWVHAWCPYWRRLKGWCVWQNILVQTSHVLIICALEGSRKLEGRIMLWATKLSPWQALLFSGVSEQKVEITGGCRSRWVSRNVQKWSHWAWWPLLMHRSPGCRSLLCWTEKSFHLWF